MDRAANCLVIFARHLADTSALAQLPAEKLEQQLLALYKSGQAAWPDIDLAIEDFMAHLAKSCSKEGVIETELAALRSADLYLTGACALGNPAALRTFDEHFLSQMSAFLSRMKPSPAFVDEMRQVLRELLLVGTHGRKPKIAEYAGRGSLSSWLRVTAVRTAARVRRNKGEQILSDASDLPVEAFSDGANLEMDYLKQRYQKEFKIAFQSALEKLTAQQRNLLRMQFIDGLNIEQIGTLMHVHRATVARWIAGVREEILENVKHDLQERLHLKNEEFESLVKLVRSQFQVSILRILAEKQA